MSTLGDNANLWASLFLGGYFKLLPSTRFVASPDVISTTIFTIFTTTIFSGRCLEVTELSRPQRSLPQYRWHQDCARCPTVTIIVRWWCVFLRISLELVRWSNAAYHLIFKRHQYVSLPPVFVRGVLLWGERMEALPPPQTELGPGDQHDEESEKWSEICHYRSFVHVALSQRFSHITVEIWDQFTADGIKLSFSRLFLSFFQCEFLQLAIDLRF